MTALLAAAGSGGGRSTGLEPPASTTGDLPRPGTSKQRTACLVLDVGGNSLNGIVVGGRVEGASLAWVSARRPAAGQVPSIDRGIHIEAGGAPAISTATATST